MQLISSAPALGQPYIAPPGAPADRLAILRKAFDATLRDKVFLAEAEKIRFDVAPLNADEVGHLVHETINTSAEVVAKARAALGVASRFSLP